MKKLKQTLSGKYYNLLIDEAKDRGITMQELVRVIVYEWFIMDRIEMMETE